MLFPAEIRCPKCNSIHCRESRWHSREEKARHRDMRPFRCSDCSHRFIAVDRARVETRRLLRFGAGLLTLALFALAVAMILKFDDDESDMEYAELGPLEASNARLMPPELPVTDATRIAADNGDPDAQYRVGKNLFFETTLDKDKAAEALTWLTRAAENGHTDAMIHLGRMYRTGIGALQNYDKAADWIRRAADAGDPEGMLELGRLYRDGVGVDSDAVLAYVWFNRAAAALNLDAARERESVARKLTPEQLKMAQSLSEG